MAIDTEGAGNVLTRKLGPLPTWAWAVVVAGAVLVARALGPRKAPTGGESVIGAPPIEIGSEGEPGPAGPAGPAGGTSAVPGGNYTALLNQLLDWFQQLNRTSQLIARLRDQIANTSDPAKKTRLKAALAKATSAEGKFTYSGSTYYSQSFLQTKINELQAKLGGLT